LAGVSRSTATPAKQHHGVRTSNNKVLKKNEIRRVVCGGR